jgi:Starter unit:ACP transacylase in aflatoxin biosynthesis/Beta-ketoacyl synthase, N-terminal domain
VATNNIILGVCLGELSAAAVSLAKTLNELLPLAVASVRVAFRTGLATERTAREVETSGSSRRSWSLAISRESGAANPGVLERIHSATVRSLLGGLQHVNGLQSTPSRNRVYISAYSPSTVTLSGPPSSLQRVVREFKNVRSIELPITVPYHAQHLYADETISEVLDSAALRAAYDSVQSQDLGRTLLSGSDGVFCNPSSPRALLDIALRHILISPIDWERMERGCLDTLSSSDSWLFRPFGPTSSCTTLISSLSNRSASKIKLDEAFWKDVWLETQPSRAPLAIVGMAGRFPGATNHDELWELLAEGRDCHMEVGRNVYPENLVSNAYRFRKIDSMPKRILISLLTDASLMLQGCSTLDFSVCRHGRPCKRNLGSAFR